MYYIYYNDDGDITAVANITDDSLGLHYIEVDLLTYTEFSNETKKIIDYVVTENVKIKGKMHIVLKDIEMLDTHTQPNGIIVKKDKEENAIILTQDIDNITWTVTSTMSDELCALFAQGDNCIKDYYIVDPNNRFILLDTLQVNLKTLALNDIIYVDNYNREVCKQHVNLLCSASHIKHIHNVQEQ